MCEPISMAITGLKVAESVGGFLEQKSAMKRQEKAYWQNRTNAIDSAKSESAATLASFSQFLAGASQRVNQIRREEAEAASETAISTAEAGIEGNSADILLMDVARRAEEGVTAVQENVENERTAARFRMNEISATATARTNGVQRGTAPSVFQLAMGVAKAGVGAWDRADAASNGRQQSKV